MGGSAEVNILHHSDSQDTNAHRKRVRTEVVKKKKSLETKEEEEGRVKKKHGVEGVCKSKSAKLSRHVSHLWQPHYIYMSIDKSMNKILEINHNNYRTIINIFHIQ